MRSKGIVGPVLSILVILFACYYLALSEYGQVQWVDIISGCASRLKNEDISEVRFQVQDDSKVYEGTLLRGYGYAMSWNVSLKRKGVRVADINLANDYGYPGAGSWPQCFIASGLQVVTVQPESRQIRGLKTYQLLHLGIWQWKEVDRKLIPVASACTVRRLLEQEGLKRIEFKLLD